MLFDHSILENGDDPNQVRRVRHIVHLLEHAIVDLTNRDSSTARLPPTNASSQVPRSW